MINERPYYGYYVPVKNSDDSIVGMVFVGRESKDINAFIKSKSSAVFLMALIIMAMAAIGLNSNVVKLIKSGGKPLLLGACCWVGITIVSLGMQHVMGIW